MLKNANGEKVVAPNMSKEQANSILNISSQGGARISFLNQKHRVGKRHKSKDRKASYRFPIGVSYQVNKIGVADEIIDRNWTHDNRAAELINIDTSGGATNGEEDYNTLTMVNKEVPFPGYSQELGGLHSNLEPMNSAKNVKPFVEYKKGMVK